MSLFAKRNVEAFTQSLTKYVPGGKLFQSKNDTSRVLYKFLNGFGPELFRANDLLKQYSEEILPDTTEKFLSEWESALGIPDDCFSGKGTTEERRRDILVKLAALGVQTEQDFIDLAVKFGVTILVFPGLDVFNTPSLAPGVTFYSKQEARFTIVISFILDAGAKFPYTFPIPFGDNLIAILECLFNNLKQSNSKTIFIQV